MSDHNQHPVFDGFQTLWVFNPKKNNTLLHNEMLVYSALAHADCRGLYPTNKDLAWRTGLNRNSIPSILEALQQHGLVEGRTPLDRPDLFQRASRKGKIQHWSQRLRFWKCLVRCGSSKLTVSDQSVLSYIWWSQVNGFNPPKGWSVPYLASILHLQKKTVRAAIDRLVKMCLLRITDKQWCVPKNLSPLQEDWFIRKSADASEDAKVTLGEFEPDMRELANGYGPGDVIGVVEPVKPHQPVDVLTVHQYLQSLIGSDRLDVKAKNRICEAARREAKQVGCIGDSWKPVVDRHFEEYVAEHCEPQVYSDEPEPSILVENEDLKRELEQAGFHLPE